MLAVNRICVVIVPWWGMPPGNWKAHVITCLGEHLCMGSNCGVLGH